MVRYAGDAPQPVITRWPEIVPAYDGPAGAGRVQAWVVGPGAGVDDAARGRLEEVLAAGVPILIDADAITLVAEDETLRAKVRARGAATVLTPHEGEFARLGGDLSHPEGRIAAVRQVAEQLQATVLLKGTTTVVASGHGPATLAMSGPPALATAGSGDVLSGLAGSMLAAQREPLDDVRIRRVMAAAAYVHGVAGRLASAHDRPIVSEDVLACVPEAVALAWRSHHSI